jgi:hypothetical protein
MPALIGKRLRGNLARQIHWNWQQYPLDNRHAVCPLREALMAQRHILMIAIGAALAWSGLSAAQEYRPDEFLGLDLSSAVLSPKPLGPTAGFKPGPLDVTVDRGNNAVQANGVTVAEPKAVPTATVHVEQKSTNRTALNTAVSGMRAAHARVGRSAPRAPRALVALHRRNPVEAQARDTSIQVWPCRSGGICNWKR